MTGLACGQWMEYWEFMKDQPFYAWMLASALVHVWLEPIPCVAQQNRAAILRAAVDGARSCRCQAGPWRAGLATGLASTSYRACQDAACRR